MLSHLLNIFFRIIKIDRSFYKDNRNFGEAAIYFSISIVLIVSIVGIVPNNVFLNYMSEEFNLGYINAPSIRSIIFGAFILWIIKTAYLYFVAVILFPNKKTECNFRKMFILVGFAQAPFIFNIFAFNTFLLSILFVSYIWYNLALIIGLNIILNYKSVVKSTIVVLGPFIIVFIYIFLNLMATGQVNTIS